MAGGPILILSEKNGFDSYVYPIVWFSTKKDAKTLTCILIPTFVVAAAVAYFFMSYISVLVMVVFGVVVVSLLLGYLAIGKEARYTIVPVRTKERGGEEYKRVYWRLIEILTRILDKKGFGHEEVAEWPKTAYGVADKGFEVSVNAGHRYGEVYFYRLLIGPVTADNHMYVEILQKLLSQSIVEEGLVYPRGRTANRS